MSIPIFSLVVGTLPMSFYMGFGIVLLFIEFIVHAILITLVMAGFSKAILHLTLDTNIGKGYKAAWAISMLLLPIIAIAFWFYRPFSFVLYPLIFSLYIPTLLLALLVWWRQRNQSSG